MAGFAAALTFFTPPQVIPGNSFVIQGGYTPAPLPPSPHPGGGFSTALTFYTPNQVRPGQAFVMQGGYMPAAPPIPPQPAVSPGVNGGFPPTGPTTLLNILKAYVYQQYADDINIQAFNTAFNTIAQVYMDWFVQTELPIYTGLTGPLLDWVAEGLYGVYRPSLPFGYVTGVGTPNTFLPNTQTPNTWLTTGSIQDFTVNDDYFRRIITWFFFKGDGFYFTLTWLKRRIMRFLLGVDGAAPNIDNAYPISVSFGVSNVVEVVINITSAFPVDPVAANIFQAGVESGALQLPFQFSWSVTINNAVTNLINVGGTLTLISTAGWPLTSTGLSAGQLWSNSSSVNVVPTTTPSSTAAPVFFGVITSSALLALGGANLPLTDPHNVDQLYVSGNVVTISNG